MVSFDFETETKKGTENEYSKFHHRMYRSPDHQHAGPGPGFDPGRFGAECIVSGIGHENHNENHPPRYGPPQATDDPPSPGYGRSDGRDGQGW
jgi:hypothetical protein